MSSNSSDDTLCEFEQLSPLPRISTAYKVIRTVLLYMAYMGMGLLMVLPGPTLMDLALRINTDIVHISSIYTARSIGQLVSVLTSKATFDYVHPDIIFCIVFLSATISTAIIPWCFSLNVLYAAVAVHGFTSGTLNIGANVVILSIWGKKKNGPYMQALHFFWGLGALSAPFIAHPFLAPYTDDDTDVETFNIEEDITAIDTDQETDASYTTKIMTTLGRNETKTPDVFSCLLLNLTNTSKITFSETLRGSVIRAWYKFSCYGESKIQFPYTIAALYMLVVTVLYMVMSCTSRQKSWATSVYRQQQQTPAPHNRIWSRTRFTIGFIVLLCIFFYCFVGGENSYGAFITMFAVSSKLQLQKRTGTLLSVVYFTAFTVMRCIGIYLARFIPVSMILIACLVALSLNTCMLSLFSSSSQEVLWIGSVLQGAAFGPIFPSVFTWTNQYITVTFKTSSIFSMMIALQEMTLPVLIGYLFDKTGPISFMYSQLAIVILLVLSFCGARLWIHRYKRNNYYQTRCRMTQKRNGNNNCRQEIQMEPRSRFINSTTPTFEPGLHRNYSQELLLKLLNDR